METIRKFAFTLSLCIVFASRICSQGQDRFDGWCDSLRNSTSADLVQFLNAVVPDETSSPCVTWAIHSLEKERYEPAINSLVRLLDFRRPQTPQEKLGFYLRPQIIEEMYPAANALEVIGKKTLPAVLAAITASSSSETARHNAVTVWIEIHREGDKQPNGIALLKQEEAKAKDEAIKRRLEWAVQEALKRCNPAERTACRDAASGRASPQ